jgi:formate dehydrogenase subunit gamma
VTIPPSPESAEIVAIIAALKDRPGALLPILHAIQDTLGHIPADAVAAIAWALNLSTAEVHGVIGFYRHFRREPPGRTVLRLCRAEACQARGASALVAHARAALGCDFHQTTADGAITLEPVFCLGLCASGPAVAVGDDALHAGVDAARLNAVIRAAREAK